MQKATISSVCECQAKLEVELDERLHVRRGWARRAHRCGAECAPARSVSATASDFSVAWLCPFCARNTLRRFSAELLVWTQDQDGETGNKDAIPA